MRYDELVERELLSAPRDTIIVTPGLAVPRELGNFGGGAHKRLSRMEDAAVSTQRKNEAVCLTEIWEKGRITLGLAVYVALDMDDEFSLGVELLCSLSRTAIEKELQEIKDEIWKPLNLLKSTEEIKKGKASDWGARRSSRGIDSLELYERTHD